MIKEYYAEGSDKQSYFTQLAPHTPPNDTSHYSGCGAAAWMNLFGWHAINFTPGLLSKGFRDDNEYSSLLTMKLHDYLHTTGIPFSDQGLTWPWHMDGGCSFAREILSYQIDGFKYRIRNFATSLLGYRDGSWVFEIAKEYIIDKKKPVIVGYLKDWHFAIGYGILENPTVTGKPPVYLLKINKAWGIEGSSDNDAIISPKDLFSCFAVDSFSPLVHE